MTERWVWDRRAPARPRDDGNGRRCVRCGHLPEAHVWVAVVARPEGAPVDAMDAAQAVWLCPTAWYLSAARAEASQE